MKKIFLLLAGGLITFGANAQYRKSTVVDVQNTTRTSIVNIPKVQEPTGNNHSTARTTSTAPFYTEDFSSGAATGMPTGWSTGVMPGGAGVWHWEITASTATYSNGVMHSSTASNGWMIFDSDSIGGPGNTAITPSGWLQSPMYNCSAHTTVRLNFEDYYRRFQDSCFVWVGTNSSFTAGTYTVYPVSLNNNLATNSGTINSDTAHVNISSAAGGQSTVYIRFVYYGPPGGGYSWLIDDMSLSQLDSVDVSLGKSCVLYYTGSNFSSFGTMPAKIVDTVYPETFAANLGATIEPSVAVNAAIYQGSTATGYNKTVNVALPVNAADSLADFTQSSVQPGYYSNTLATYTVDFSTNTAADSVTSNNADTATFIVTDSTWSENPVRDGKISLQGGTYIYRPAAGGTPALAYSTGTEFDIAAGQVDTLTSVSVSFYSGTVAGQVVGIQIYHFDATSTSWIYDGVTTFRALTATDINTATTIRYGTFPVDMVSTGGYIILNGGTTGVPYAAIVKGSGNTAQVVVEDGANPAPYALVGYVGLEDTSNNNGAGSQDFGNGHLPFGNASTPLVKLNFGIIPTAVQNVSLSKFIGKAYPNPANTSVNIPFTLNQDAIVNVTLSDIIGQVVNTQEINAKNGQTMTATFATGALPSGVYFYTIDVNGQRSTGRMVVAH